jgi:hypothetical protein
MNAQRKHREGWDDGFYLARSDPEREPKPRLEATVVELPKRVRLEPARAIEAWESIGLEITERRIRAHTTELKTWERRVK